MLDCLLLHQLLAFLIYDLLATEILISKRTLLFFNIVLIIQVPLQLYVNLKSPFFKKN